MTDEAEKRGLRQEVEDLKARVTALEAQTPTTDESIEQIEK